MAKQSRELYLTGNPELNSILARVALRLDTIEGLLPDLGAGLYRLGANKSVSTTTDGTMAGQEALSVEITGGVITISNADGTVMTIKNAILKITDSDGTVIHQTGDMA